MNSLRLLRLARPAPAPPPFGPAVRPFSTVYALRHGERHGEHQKGHDAPAFEVEKLKQASLEQQKKGQGEWVPDLASDSEANIKADKSSFDVKDTKDKGEKANK